MTWRVHLQAEGWGAGALVLAVPIQGLRKPSSLQTTWEVQPLGDGLSAENQGPWANIARKDLRLALPEAA